MREEGDLGEEDLMKIHFVSEGDYDGKGGKEGD